MPTYEIKAPDGNAYRIEGPAGATDDQVREQVLKQHPTAGTPKAAEPAATRTTTADVLIEGGKGLARGVAGFAGDIGEAVMGPFGPSKHFANLKADITGGERPKPDAPYSQQISKAAGIDAAPQTTAGEFASTTGEVMGNPLTYAGAGSTALKIGAGLAGGIGSEAAGQLTKGTPLEGPARVAGGIVAGTGAATAAAERNLSKLAAQLPSHESIKDAASQIYESLKTSNVAISPQGMDALLGQIKTDLNHDGFRSWPGAPGAPVFQVVEELATSGGTVNGVDAVRKVLGRYKSDPANQFAADRAIDAIDDFMMHVDPKYVVSGNPQQDAQALKYAQSLWATHKQLQMIEEGSVKGQNRAGATGTGANKINTARQEINKILNSDKKSRGLSQDVKDKMREIVLGTWLTNKARQLGKYAPSGPVSSGATIAAGFAGGAPAAAGVAGVGYLAKHLGEYLTDKQIRELEQLIKSESPMGAPVAQNIAPKIAEQKAVPAAAAARAALTSPLGPGERYDVYR